MHFHKGVEFDELLVVVVNGLKHGQLQIGSCWGLGVAGDSYCILLLAKRCANARLQESLGHASEIAWNFPEWITGSRKLCNSSFRLLLAFVSRALVKRPCWLPVTQACIKQTARTHVQYITDGMQNQAKG